VNQLQMNRIAHLRTQGWEVLNPSRNEEKRYRVVRGRVYMFNIAKDPVPSFERMNDLLTVYENGDVFPQNKAWIPSHDERPTHDVVIPLEVEEVAA
jgi:hypothetical protein